MSTDPLELEEQEEEESAAVDPLEIARFMLGAARRYWWAGALVGVAVAALGVTVAVFLPKKYETQTRILVGQEGFMSHVNPERRAVRVDEFRGLTERMYRQENIRAIVEEADLATLWTKHRPPLLRFKDRVMGNGLENLDERTQIRALMGTLEHRLSFETDQSTTITIRATWTDPHTAARIAEVARKRFFEDRLKSELDVFQEVLSIQEEQAKAAAREMERLLVQVERASWRDPPPADAAPQAQVVEVSAQPAKKPDPDPLLVAKLERVRQRIRETQEPWQRRVMELKLRLTDLRASYESKHPMVVHQEKRIQEASVPPPELEALKAEESQLLAQIEAYSRPQADAEEGKRKVRVSASTSPSNPQPVRVEHSATLSAEQSKLIQATNKYNDLSERIANTRLEIATAETAFKHRYLIAADPEVPEAPLKPKLPLIIGAASIVLGLVLGFAVGTVLQLLGGRVLAPWQVKRLGIPILGEIDMSSSGR